MSDNGPPSQQAQTDQRLIESGLSVWVFSMTGAAATRPGFSSTTNTLNSQQQQVGLIVSSGLGYRRRLTCRLQPASASATSFLLVVLGRAFIDHETIPAQAWPGLDRVFAKPPSVHVRLASNVQRRPTTFIRGPPISPALTILPIGD